MNNSMLEVVALNCGHGDIIAVDGLPFTVGAGEIFGLVGANGAGKSASSATRTPDGERRGGKRESPAQPPPGSTSRPRTFCPA